MTTLGKAIMATLALSCVLGATTLAHAQGLEARLSPDTVAPGESATLVVTMQGSEAVPPTVAAPPGVRVQSTGQQTSVKVTNGQVSQTVSYLYSVSSDEIGDFTLDGIRAGGERAPALTLHVSEQARASANPNSRHGYAAVGARPTQTSELAFLRLRVDGKRLYVGQSVPVTVQAYFRAGTAVTLSGRPQLTSDAFTLSGLDEEPRQSEATIDGEPFLVVTWRGALTAAKAGEQRAQLTLPASLQYRERPAMTAAPGASVRDLLGDSFSQLMQDPMFGAILDDAFLDGSLSEIMQPPRLVTRDVTLTSKGAAVVVASLPEAGKPANFTGAVGSFDIKADLEGTELTQGEPQDLRVVVTGEGNFGQFEAPSLASSAAFRTYTPRNSFAPSDKAGLRGTQTSSQPVAAVQAGAHELPSIAFSYFDPRAGRYVTKHTAPIPITVARAQTSETDMAVRVPESARRDDTVVTRTLSRGGVPPWLFAASGGVSLLLALVAALLGLQRSRYVRGKAHTIASRYRARRQRRSMLRAARRGDVKAFLRSARTAIRMHLAASWGTPAESITGREVDERWPSAPDSVRQVFALADELDYASHPRSELPIRDLPALSRNVARQLSTLEAAS